MNEDLLNCGYQRTESLASNNIVDHIGGSLAQSSLTFTDCAKTL